MAKVNTDAGLHQEGPAHDTSSTWTSVGPRRLQRPDCDAPEDLDDPDRDKSRSSFYQPDPPQPRGALLTAWCCCSSKRSATKEVTSNTVKVQRGHEAEAIDGIGPGSEDIVDAKMPRTIKPSSIHSITKSSLKTADQFSHLQLPPPANQEDSAKDPDVVGRSDGGAAEEDGTGPEGSDQDVPVRFVWDHGGRKVIVCILHNNGVHLTSPLTRGGPLGDLEGPLEAVLRVPPGRCEFR